MMHVSDAEMHILTVNDYWLQVTGYECGEVLGCSITKFLSWRSQQYFREVVLPELRHNGSCRNVPYQLINKRGEVIDLLLSATSERDGQNQIMRYLVVSVDITDCVFTEAARWNHTEQELLVSRITQRIRTSLNLAEILAITAIEVREFLIADHVFIYRLDHDQGGGKIMAESSQSKNYDQLDRALAEYYLSENTAHQLHGNVEVINDIDRSVLPASIAIPLKQNLIAACLIVPILAEVDIPNQLVANDHHDGDRQALGNHCSSDLRDPQIPTSHSDRASFARLWGVMFVNQEQTRYWKLPEVNLVTALANQVAIAIRQAQLYEELNQSRQQLEDTNQQLSRLVTSDYLTGVANRRYFDEYLAQVWSHHKQQKLPLSLVMCDIDYFKNFNDTYGHQEGDRCLQQVAEVISNTLTELAMELEQDSFLFTLMHFLAQNNFRSHNPLSYLVARYGGEEFAVVLPNTNSLRAYQIAHQLRNRVAALQIPNAEARRNPYISLSYGIATLFPIDRSQPDMLITFADHALYQAKAEGRDRIYLIGSNAEAKQDNQLGESS
ncbi:diguanylate cyclase [Thalassoporum mexicanum PCC 7367]|nr:diguanylate cyclase [Pseudanabaena sp. PCC 7367]